MRVAEREVVGREEEARKGVLVAERMERREERTYLWQR